jgi:hypothetical protein
MSLVGSLRGVQAIPEPCNSNSNIFAAPTRIWTKLYIVCLAAFPRYLFEGVELTALEKANLTTSTDHFVDFITKFRKFEINMCVVCDRRYLFEGVELTAREKADLEYKQRVYDLALERRKALEGLVDDGYSMPTNYGKPSPFLIDFHPQAKAVLTNFFRPVYCTVHGLVHAVQ